MDKTYTDLIKVVQDNKEKIIALLQKAHRFSLRLDPPDTDCSIVAVSRQTGSLTSRIIKQDEQPDDLYILAAFPHIDPLAAVVLYEDERAQVLSQWCQEHGLAAPAQAADELDPPYWQRLLTWFNENTSHDAEQILTGLVREQLEAAFSAEDEFADALDELIDLAQGIVRLPPEDDDDTEVSRK